MHSFNLIFVDMVTMYEISNKNVACTFGFKCLYCVVHYFQRNVDHIFIEASDKPFPKKKLRNLEVPKSFLIHVPGRFDQELGWWKPTKAKDAQQCITFYATIHNSMLSYYFRHTKDFIGQNTRGRSPNASLDINTTSDYCPVSLSRVAQLVERQTPDSEVPGSNPTKTQLFCLINFFFSSFVESMFNTTQKSHLKKEIKFLSIWVPILKGWATKNSVDEPSKVTI